MMRLRLGFAGLAVITAIAAACSDSSTGTSSGTDLSGTYDLVTLKLDTLTTSSSGVLVFTTTNFTTNIHVLTPTDTILLLAGTYVTHGSDSIYLVLPQPFPQLPGTYTRSAAKDSLYLSVLFSTTALHTVWHKQ